MSDFDDLMKVVVRLRAELAEVRHRQATMFRVGTVEQSDAKKGYQIKFGEDGGKAIPSPWYPHPEEGGTRKTWRPMPKGQIVYVIAPDGDHRQGLIIPKGGFSDQNKQPSENMDEHVEEFGKEGDKDKFRVVKNADGMTMTWGDKRSYSFGKDGIVEKVGDHKRETKDDGTTFKEGKIRHDDRNIGKDHKHADVMTGSDKTGDPEA